MIPRGKILSFPKIILTAICIGIILIFLLILAVGYFNTQDHTNYLYSFYSPIESSQVDQIGYDEFGYVYSVLIRSKTLPALRCYLRIPVDRKPSPAVILVGGLNTGREAIFLVGRTDLTKNIVFMTMDYPYEGKTKKVPIVEFLNELPNIRRAVMASVGGVLTMVEYLTWIPEVKSDEIFTAGVSFGGFFAIIGGALDTRIKGVMSFFTAGNIGSLITHNLEYQDIGPNLLRKPAGYLAQLLLYPVEPLRYVDRITPRHFLMVNGSDDEMLPLDSVEQLYDTAGEPKDIIWLDTDHVQGWKEQLHQELTRIGTTWLVEKELIAVREP